MFRRRSNWRSCEVDLTKSTEQIGVVTFKLTPAGLVGLEKFLFEDLLPCLPCLLRLASFHGLLRTLPLPRVFDFDFSMFKVIYYSYFGGQWPPSQKEWSYFDAATSILYLYVRPCWSRNVSALVSKPAVMVVVYHDCVRGITYYNVWVALDMEGVQ